MPKIVFIYPDGSEVCAETECGSTVMNAAVRNDIEGIAAECGGSLSCGTCHVYVDDRWLTRVSPASEEELLLLEFVPDVKLSSRLSCQIRVCDALDGIVVRVPLLIGN